ncbi:MAG TPA: right-handed parallel beta-helix repeat-containing protein [Thermoanaerobaculia bacterium]|nr:right-handed parallel beta-helix repeat-containing protein [Thermoanaerobaculia bacterium]
MLATAVALASAAAAPASEFFAAPDGTPSGDGSRRRPWDLATALAQPARVHPGDTVLLLAGVYRGEFRAALRGRPGAPVVVRAAPSARATIDGTLKISGHDAWYRDFEVTSSAALRVSRQEGPYPTDVPRGILETEETGATGAGLKLIDLVAHDLASVALWKEAIDLEVSGCLVYYNGWTAPDRGHGHGIYVQNVVGTKRIVDNVIFENFDNGIQAYGSAKAGLDNLDIEGNTIFENGTPVGDPANNILVGGGRVAANTRIVGNLLWYSGGRGTQINLGYDPYGRGVDRAVVRDNVVVNGEVRMNPKNGVVDFSGNTVFASLANLDAGRFPGNRYVRQPIGSAVFVRPDRYEKGRAIVTVFNADRRPAAVVDLSAVLRGGDRFEIRNAQDFYGTPVAAGVYRGAGVNVPLRAFPPARPVGWKTPPGTGPEFNVFVVTSATTAAAHQRAASGAGR